MQPNILVLTDEGISYAHGTGTVLMRHFEAYPKGKIFNIYPMENGDPYFENHLHAKAGLISYNITAGLSEIGLHGSMLYHFFENKWFEDLKKKLIELEFVPEVIYSAGSTRRGIMLLVELIKLYPKVPIIQHFMDYLPFGLKDVPLNLKRIVPQLIGIWSLTENFCNKFESILGIRPELVRVFHCDLPEKHKIEHKNYRPDFKAIMIGNCWIPELINDLKEAWEWLSTQLVGLGKIEWYVHPDTIKWLDEKGITLGNEIINMGYFTKEEFWTKLREADMAIIPFNGKEIPENEYARYSLPSRITEIASIGLPVFCSAGPGTELKSYIENKGIGKCSLLSQKAQFKKDLYEFVTNKKQRSNFGKNARTLAENEFNLSDYQNWFYKQLSTIANQEKV